MDIIFTQITPWHWWGLGAFLIILEMFSATSYLLWIGLSAILTGFLVWLIPGLLWQWQLAIFAVDAVLNVVIGAKFYKKAVDEEQLTLNRRGSSYIGQVITLSEPIVHGTGYARIDDTRWRVAGEDLPAGTRVRVVGLEDMILKVEKE